MNRHVAASTARSQPIHIGDHLREWRQRRHLSQLDLATDAEISARHLSFVETGRAAPSRDMVLRLAERLDVPLRERNVLLVAAGFAPAFAQRTLDDPALTAARSAIDLVLKAHEPNPALGVRGLRTLLDHPEVLRTQLRALARAAEGLPVHLEVMAPMVADRIDAKAFADACREAGLAAKFGAMVEIPSAALRARSILQEVEFLSLGTNDLAQYTFAADRQVGAVSRLQDPWQPALLDLVAAAAEAARAEGKSCGVCGEAASDPLLACVLTGLGVTSLSMGAASLPYVRATLAKHTLAQCERAAAAARATDTAEEARRAAQAVLSGE